MSLKARLNLVLLVASVPFLVLAGRLSYLQILQRSHLGNMASQQVEREVLVPQPRGRIVDRNGDVLAESVPSWSCWIDKKLLNESHKPVEPLIKALGMTPEAFQQRLKGKGQVVSVKKDLDIDSARAVAKLAVPGVGLEQKDRRSYPNGDMTRGVLGAVGAEGRGLSGLEYLFDKDLRPSAQRSEVIRDGKGRLIFSKGGASLPPRKLVLTIDRNLQYFAETALAEAVKKADARWGVVLAQDPRTGELLVAADYPADPLKNRAFQDSFEPGSTLKPVTALAAVEGRLVGPQETFDCEHGSWEMAPRVTIHDHEPQDLLTLSQIIERSSNIGMAKVSERVGAERFYRYARAFGFGSRTGLAYPGEAAGILKGPRALDRVHLAQVSFGQGMAASAVQLVTAYSAFANGGTLMEPRLLRGVQEDTGVWAKSWEPASVRRAATVEGAAAVRKMLLGVVEDGTGKAAAVPGYSVAGKTGTAQKVDPATGKYSKTLYTSSFIGFFPAENPRITLLVVLDEPRRGYYGSDVAAPVFARLAKDMLAKMGIAPDRAVAEGVRAAPTSR